MKTSLPGAGATEVSKLPLPLAGSQVPPVGLVKVTKVE